MKKIYLSLLAVVLSAIPFLSVFAGPGDIMPSKNSTAGQGLTMSMVDQPITTTLTTVANYVIGALVLLAVFYVLWAAYTFITSSGEQEKISQARSRIMYAGIGVIVALLAKGIVSLVLSAVK